jgi:hypothetical protein
MRGADRTEPIWHRACQHSQLHQVRSEQGLPRPPEIRSNIYYTVLVEPRSSSRRCVECGEPPALFGVEPPRPRIEVVRIVNMSSSNAWAELADIFIRTREAHLEHEKAKAELKGLMPEDAQQAIGHGIGAKRSNAISFDLLKVQGESHAATIGIIAGALAKAQAELTNPEKSLVATIRTGWSGSRYRTLVSLCATFQRA